MITSKGPDWKQKPKYECIFCDFNTSKLSKYERHLLTRKHLNNTGKGPKKSKKVRSVEIKCNYCKKIYKHRSGLSRHQKKCKKNLITY